MSGNLSMNSVLKNNRNLLQKYKKAVKKKPFKGREGEIAIKEISESELQLLQVKIVKAHRRENVRKLVISVIILIPIIWFMRSMYMEFVKYKNQELYHIELLKQKEIDNEKERVAIATLSIYKRQLNEGDKWIENKNWKNAIYFYKSAVGFYPDKFEANYRLVLAYSYHCKYENFDCEIGKEWNDKLLKYFPDDERLLTLKAIFDK